MQYALEIQDLANEGSESDNRHTNSWAPEDATKSLYNLGAK
jgi:hypothetical protein